MKKNIKYKKWLIEQLKDREEALAYLNAALEESLKEGEHIFFNALKNVIAAYEEPLFKS